MFFSVFHRQGFDKMYFFFALANLLFIILIGFHELQLKRNLLTYDNLLQKLKISLYMLGRCKPYQYLLDHCNSINTHFYKDRSHYSFGDER